MRIGDHSRIHGIPSRLRRPKSRSFSAAAEEIKMVLGARLGASLVESSDPLWKRGSRHRGHEDRLQTARLQGWCRFSCRNCCSGWAQTESPCSKSLRRRSFQPSLRPERFSAQAACSRSTTSSNLRREGIEPPSNLDIATIQHQELAMAFRFHIPQYLTRRAADWRAQRLHRNLSRLSDPQRALEILG